LQLAIKINLVKRSMSSLRYVSHDGYVQYSHSRPHRRWAVGNLFSNADNRDPVPSLPATTKSSDLSLDRYNLDHVLDLGVSVQD